jgi:tape measure domain-containing protein
MSTLQELTVKYGVDLSDLQTGSATAKDIITGLGPAASAASAVITEGLTGAGQAASSFALMSQMAAENAAAALAQPADALESLQGVAENAASGLAGSLTSVGPAATDAAAQIDSLASSADTTAGSLADLAAQAETTGADVEDAGSEAGGGFSGAISGVVGFGSQIGQTMFGMQAMANVAGNLASGLLGPAEQAENTSEAFDNLLGSTAAASNEIEKLNTFAAATEFPTEDIDQDGEKLIGFGVSAKNVIPDLTSLGDALSAVGKGTPAELEETVGVIGKISVQGKITAADINELGAHGINALQAIATGAGVSTSEIQKMIANGTLPANQAIADLTKGIEKNPMLSGGMAKQSETLSGKMSTLTSDFHEFMASLVGPALPALETGMGNLTALVTSPSFKTFAVTTGTDIAGGLKAVAGAVTGVVTVGTGLIGFFQNNQTAMDALVAVLSTAAAMMLTFAILSIPSLVVAFGAWAAGMLPVVVETMLTIGPYILVGAVVAAVVFGVVEAIQHWGSIMSWIGGVCGNIGSGIGGFFSGLGSKVHAIVGAMGDSFGSLGNKIGGVWNGIVGDVKGGINGVISAIDAFIEGVDSIHVSLPGGGSLGFSIPTIPYLASGGTLMPGQWGVVGENGPELTRGGSSGTTVFSNPKSVAMLNGGGSSSGGGNYTTTINFNFDGKVIATLVATSTAKIVVEKIYGHGNVKGVAA